MAIWKIASSGVWSLAGNWVSDTLPVNNDTVIFPTGTYTSTIDPAFLVSALSSIDLAPGVTVDVERSISVTAVNGSFSANGTANSSGLLEVGNGATLNYDPLGGSLVNTTDGTNGFYVKGDGVSTEGHVIIGGDISTGATITADGVGLDATGGITDSSAVVTLKNGGNYIAQATETFTLGTVNLFGGGDANFGALGTGAMAFGSLDPADPHVVVMSGSNNELVLPNTPDAEALNITGFGRSDSIEIATLGPVGSVTYDADNLVFHSGINGTGSLLATLNDVTLAAGEPATLDASNFSVVNDPSGATVTFLSCFTPGTRIATDKGEMKVEDIREDDLVMVQTESGSEPRRVIWIGHRKLDLARHPDPSKIAPVRIRQGAFADNVPHRDLVISPDHAIFTGDGLVPAGLLVNGMTIVRELPKTVEYFHIECESHSVILAEGLPVETYLDSGNRRAEFDNAKVMVLHPNFSTAMRWETLACHPLLMAPGAILPIQRRLSDRARQLGHLPGATAAPEARNAGTRRHFRPAEQSVAARNALAV